MTSSPSSEPIRLAVDCMGGDHGPSVTLPACRAFLDKHPGAELLLVGKPEALTAAAAWPRCRVVAASEVVTMDDPIEVALRRKRDSSMRVAIQQLRADRDGNPASAHACVSAGNTGALMAVAKVLLKTLDGIDRPAIATVMPNQRGRFTTVLDLGANVDCTAEHLLQFAVMGSALVAAVEGNEEPSVGLLNIGEEAIKGSETIKQAGELLRAEGSSGRINFFGNVEGNDIYKGTTDIVVCDGFVGNVMLKTSEGLATMMGAFIKEEFSRNLLTKAAALVAMPVLNAFKNRVDHRRFNGAALLGLRGLVFKSHGSADAFAFEMALARAYDAARNRLLDRVHDRIVATLQARATDAGDNAADSVAQAA
ncbi:MULTISPECIES: phosphate acyltransferase PlsX [Roseateles]|uniref:Phosphate acyltransferase n=1 Tax=Pelomonas caseinilytica TaxID=2906763 RepID=A0ABS8XI07_9BURK|nr:MULTISPECIES: phosphate acyltransferase PlsX [unclassified Roseateles]MCE4538199.1 phosphate acyltransferase PlsX [Pelomonas sp. P7]HEV6966472.1 phosphate acyltransferase PlsX [Roseateles sp.]